LSASEYAAAVDLASGARIEAGLVVAADGRRSQLREAAGLKVTSWPYRQTGIVTLVSHDRPHNGTAVQHFLPSGPFAMLPLPGDRTCITWSEEASRAAAILALSDADFLAEVDLRVGGRLGTLSLAGPRRSWPLEMHLARAYVAPRFALVGDAAHGVHPIAGQGLNLAFRDVAALTECVTETARLGFDIGSHTALERYEQWRRFDSAMSATAFDALNRLFSADQTLLRSTRELGLGIVDRISLIKRILVEEAAGLSGEVPRLLRGQPV
jgi:2-octaprenyl-6-methoxyphenol hydroxylase